MSDLFFRYLIYLILIKFLTNFYFLTDILFNLFNIN